MCVAIAQRPGAQPLTEAELSRGWRINSDGGGYAFIDRADNTIKIRKFMDEDNFTEAYYKDHAEHGAESPFLVHMRIATHGEVKVETAHPFRVELEYGGDMAFCHNGIISDLASMTDSDNSDTMAFRDYYLEELPDNWLDNPAIVELVEHYIEWSKLAFITTSSELRKEMYIVNEREGTWNATKTTWFSNDSCFAKQYDYKAWYQRDDYYDDWYQKDKDQERATEGRLAAYRGSKGSAMSLVVRTKMNDLLVGPGVDTLMETAGKQGYCEFCLFKSCQCEDTCYYCNRMMEFCDCIDMISIEQMRLYMGDSVFQEARKEELEGEYARIFQMADPAGPVEAEIVDEEDFEQEMAEIFDIKDWGG